jgi:hypothetical protein
MGVYWTVFYAGMAALPPIAGWAADAAGGAAAALGVAVGFYLAAVLAIAAYGLLLGQAPAGGEAGRLEAAGQTKA